MGTTEREARLGEDIAERVGREEPEVGDAPLGDGIGDTSDTDGELIDDEVGDVRAGRLVIADLDPSDPSSDLWADDVGIDGAGATAEEAAIHIVPDDDTVAILTSYASTAGSGARVRVSDSRRFKAPDGTGGAAEGSDVLDDLAAFLMHRVYEPGVTEAERLQALALVDAYREGDEPRTVEAALRAIAKRFSGHPDYRAEWRPAPEPPE